MIPGMNIHYQPPVITETPSKVSTTQTHPKKVQKFDRVQHGTLRQIFEDTMNMSKVARLCAEQGKVRAHYCIVTYKGPEGRKIEMLEKKSEALTRHYRLVAVGTKTYTGESMRLGGGMNIHYVNPGVR